jgi:hypothetical protein
MSGIKLSPAEVEGLTGYRVATKQLQVLHRRGFHRAYIGRDGVVLERVHYEAVAGAAEQQRKAAKPTAAANLSWMRGAA